MNEQVQERCRKLEHYALRISERYDNVEKVVIKILKSASGMEAGTEYEYNKDSKAYFFHSLCIFGMLRIQLRF